MVDLHYFTYDRGVWVLVSGVGEGVAGCEGCEFEAMAGLPGFGSENYEVLRDISLFFAKRLGMLVNHLAVSWVACQTGKIRQTCSILPSTPIDDSKFGSTYPGATGETTVASSRIIISQYSYRL